MNIVITGASKGIGKAVATAFAADNHELFLCARNEVALYNTVAELQVKYPDSTINAMVADVANKEDNKKFAEWILQKAGTADVLINNAGQFLPGSVYNEPEGLLEQMMAVNVYSAYQLTRQLLPAMMAAKQGHIFNLCSIASLQAYANGGSYSISKFALMGFSKNLREELKPYNIKVTAVYPGAVMTDSWGDFDNSNHRIMEANDIAAMIIAATKLSLQAVVEDIVIRPQLGDL
ncbi:SDR family oxidoreductase [Ferruginibacter paludis]|uniref:SDR family oxidoreductase n=1 Tax=Ferruginibacter paludis TaxID=1310417 RepID=UPI0025B51532|nr:SDR family oxidoreductase [Ferruginibacter paludis]MDN3658400.1 SDR family oxidoreductase [Ferruginibacter paludis]